MTEQTFTLTASDGVGLVGSLWNTKRPRAMLLWLHGFAEHRRRYDHFARWMSDHRVSVAAIDQRGHGESQGKRGHVVRFEDYYRDLSALIHWVKQHHPKLGTVLGSHSHGALVCARYLEEGSMPIRPVAAVMTGPFFDVGTPVPGWKDRLGVLAGRVAPGLSVPTGIPPMRLNHDARNCAAYASDRLVFRTATARWYVEMRKHQKLALSMARRITLPILVMQGLEDSIVSPQATREFFDELGTPEKHRKYIGYEGLYHEILNEPVKETLYKEILKWVTRYT